ncbi:unnamed protein product [Calicophoron daubneyi]|uniref:tRNA pseudouridine synthase n=1 Tax=Calicophoron daubneyi TaxID=300641 RepID=A0AAV2TIU2_CALDB
MRIYPYVMRRYQQLVDSLESLKLLSFEDLLKRAEQQEKRNWELENILSKIQNHNSDGKAVVATKNERKQRPFDFSKYKMRHVAIQFMYLGWGYSGLALQDPCHPVTVMGKLLECLWKCRLIEHRDGYDFAVCGRTDKGVSAIGQVVSLTVRSALVSGTGIVEDSGPNVSERLNIPDEELDYVFMLNKALPSDIRILAWSPVSPDFNARFSCSQRSYQYFFPRSGLNLEAMSAAAHRLEGTHDFRNFCSSQIDKESATFVRRIDNVHVRNLPVEDRISASWDDATAMCEVSVSASGFLYHQIRCIVSLLVMIGRGYENPSVVDDLLDLSKTPAKPQYQMAGEIPLLLTGAEYPESAVNWQTSEAAQSELVRHLQLLWSEQAIRSTVIKAALDHVEDRFHLDPHPLHYLDRIIPEGRWAKKSEGKGSHKALMKRPVEISVEEKMDRFVKKKKKSFAAEESSSPNKPLCASAPSPSATERE